MSEVHDAVGSYVLDALDPAERAEFETHLPACQRCRLDVAEFRETVAELTSLIAMTPPAELRASILGAISQADTSTETLNVRLEQRAHLRSGQTHAGLDSSGTAGPEDRRAVILQSNTGIRQGSTGTLPDGADLTDEVAPLEEHPSVVPDWTWSVPIDPPDELEPRRARRVRRVLGALVAAVVVVALALGGWVYTLSQRNQAQVAAAQRETDLLSAPDAKVLTSSVNGASVVYVVSKQRDQALFMASNLSAPGDSWTYQLWTLRGTAATSAGLVATGGTVRQWFSGSVRDSEGLAITREPSSNGSSKPTLPPLSSVSI